MIENVLPKVVIKRQLLAKFTGLAWGNPWLDFG